MTSNNLISGYAAVHSFESYRTQRWVRRLTFVEYSRRGGVYNHANGSIDGRMSIDYIAISYILNARLHIGETLGWNGFPVLDELKSFCLHNDYEHNLEFETVADGSIAILRGFARDGWRVDIFAHAHR